MCLWGFFLTCIHWSVKPSANYLFFFFWVSKVLVVPNENIELIGAGPEAQNKWWWNTNYITPQVSHKLNTKICYLSFLWLTLILINSIRRRALDLLYGMCDVSNAKDIVEELLQVYIYMYVCIYIYIYMLDQALQMSCLASKLLFVCSCFCTNANEVLSRANVYLFSVSQLCRLCYAWRIVTKNCNSIREVCPWFVMVWKCLQR